MGNFEYKQFYERKRPHIHPPGATLFVTFRLAGSIPKSTLIEYRAKKEWLDKEVKRIERQTDANQRERLFEFQRNWFRKFEEVLHAAKCGPLWLGENDVRDIVADKLQDDDGKKYRLDAFSIMSNHVHVVFRPNLSEASIKEDKTAGKPVFNSEEAVLAEIMQSLKGVTARKANIALGRTGSFWEKESYDHFIRDDAEFYRIVKYTLNNPVKAKLVSHWQEWKGNYLAKKLSDCPINFSLSEC